LSAAGHVFEDDGVMSQFLWVLVFWAIISTAGWTQEVLRVRTSEWAPYAGDPKDPLPGYVVEVIQEIFSARSITVDYRLTPWKRCIDQVRSGQIEAVLNTDSSYIPDLIYPKTPVCYYQDVFIGLADSTWVYQGMESLDSQQIGIEADYGLIETMREYIKRNAQKNVQVFSGEDVMQTGVRMLERKRIDLFINDSEAFFWAVRRLKLPPEQFKVLHLIGQGGPLYIGFSPKYPQAQKMADMVDAGLLELGKKGRLKAIAERYQMQNRLTPVQRSAAEG
jgi:polar amino acid transport system substrate-binding protein